ncbi:hypothetical protein PBI_COUNT_123 [Microbacterium phage Count]|nr:hypothetical protein PBI_COUNT_123 [Microbacterium phage Count]
MDKVDWYLLAAGNDISVKVANEIIQDRDVLEVIKDPSTNGSYLLISVNKMTSRVGYKVLNPSEAQLHQTPDIKVIVNN